MLFQTAPHHSPIDLELSKKTSREGIAHHLDAQIAVDQLIGGDAAGLQSRNAGNAMIFIFDGDGAQQDRLVLVGIANPTIQAVAGGFLVRTWG